MKKLLKTDCFRQAIAETKLSECRGFRMLPVICFKLHMDWAAVLMVKVRIYQNSNTDKLLRIKYQYINGVIDGRQ